MECENKYMELLGSYLKEQLELERHDKVVEELGCLPLDKEEQSEAQKRQIWDLNTSIFVMTCIWNVLQKRM